MSSMRYNALSIALLLVGSVHAAVAATPIFLSDCDGGGVNPSTIFRVDQSSGQLTPIASLDATLGEVLGLAAASDNTLYAVSELGGGAVMQITVSPPSVTTLGLIGNNFIAGMAFSSNGTLYAIDEATDQLSTIQLSPSVSQSVVGTVHVGSTGGPVLDVNGGDLAQDGSGSWYLWTNAPEALYRLDVTTAVAIQLGTSAGLGPKSGLAFDYQGGGTLLASSRPLHALLKLNPADGTTIPGSTVNFCLAGSCPTVYNNNFGDLASPFDCDDGNPCTEDSFVVGSGCAHTNNTAPCSDGLFCNGTDTCSGGTCSVHAGDPCPGADGDGNCAESCDETHGSCTAPDPDGSACSDGDACTQTDTCQSGVCSGSNPIVCTAQDQCHDPGTCDAGSGICSNPAKANGTACDDHDACTQTDTCQSGVCSGSTPVVCIAQDQCHDPGTCDAGSGICSNPAKANGTACNDHDACTQTDTCQSGVCSGSNPVVCTAQDQCHDAGTCDAGSGVCSNPAKANGTACNDHNACTQTDTCQSGVCSGSNPVVCTAQGQCRNVGTCDTGTGVCSNPAKPDGTACHDGDACTTNDTCSNGSCVGGPAPNCDDGNACTTDTCDQSNGCRNIPIVACCTGDADCADTSACTINERCVIPPGETRGQCTSDPITCNDNNPCTTDSCNPNPACNGAPGCDPCVYSPVPDGQSCSDLDFCNGIETCQNGQCAEGPAPNCDDSNPCTQDGCNSAVGCTHTPKPSCCFTDGDCVDNDACTVNERCIGGSCTSEVRNCNDGNLCTADTCDPGTGCVNTPLTDGTSCSNGNACDGEEKCNAGTCQAGVPPDCDDRNFCTVDSCDNTSSCQHTPVAGCCATDADCTDADLCTVNERCTAQHTCVSDPRNCDDGNICTEDICNPAFGCQHPPVASGPCDDGNLCTLGDGCSAGSCVGVARDCSDGNLCNGEETCMPQSGQCSSPGGPLLCTPGSSGVHTCAAEWYVVNPNNPEGVMSKRQVCRQGDGTCDFDADPGTCSFHVAICLRVPDPRRSCPLTDVSGYVLRRPTQKRDAATVGALLAAIDALPGVAPGARGRAERAFSPPIDTVRCTSTVTITVPLGRMKSLIGMATTVDRRRDIDGLRLKCSAR